MNIPTVTLRNFLKARNIGIGVATDAARNLHLKILFGTTQDTTTYRQAILVQ